MHTSSDSESITLSIEWFIVLCLLVLVAAIATCVTAWTARQSQMATSSSPEQQQQLQVAAPPHHHLPTPSALERADHHNIYVDSYIKYLPEKRDGPPHDAEKEVWSDSDETLVDREG